MRVTMLVRCLAMMRGGGETRHLAWMKELAALGVEVDVIAGEPLVFGRARYPVDEAPAELIRSPYLRDAVYRWQHTRGFGRLTTTALHVDEEWFCREAWRRIASRPAPPDVVHAHAIYQAARLRRGDIPVVVNLPGAPHARYTADLAEADALVADGWAADHVPGLVGQPVVRVPKGVDADRFAPGGSSLRQRLGLGGAPVVLAVGRLVPIKNLRLLIEAMPAVRRHVPGTVALIAGDGPEQARLQQRTREVGAADAVRFVGFVPHGELPAYYRSADVFVLTSTFDNSPNVVLEAMASGLPVVCTDVGGVHEFVDRAGGDLVARGDATALAAALASWLASPERRAAAGVHNRRVVLERHSWRASAERLLDVYHRVIAARAARRRQVPA
jgi:glycosyltransferase involved in cell wall biosynthesis